MNTDNITQIILAIISIIVPLATLFVSVRTHNKSNDTNQNQSSSSKQAQASIDKIEQKLDGVIERLDKNDLQTCRIDFRQVLHNSPDNIPACLEIARIYFLNMKGNADMGRKFLAWVKKYEVEKWAEEHDEDIANLIEAASHSA